ncbi:MAG: putative toxin-antitoxin system toxin component, PIN family [bacterium]|nr:putative toxin-antitoxin system toxin component, PIN family [bacterium]
MKIVLDTNVLISAFVFEGFSKEVFEHCYAYHQLYTSEWLIDEFTGKVHTKFKIPVNEIETAVKLIRKGFQVANPSGSRPVVCRDDDDNNVLWLAESVKSDFIITGDKDLLVLNKYSDIRIGSPRNFYEEEIKKQ